MGEALLAAFGLMLVVEGLLPFVAPGMWRDAFRKAVELKDGQLRTGGLIAIVVGLVILSLAL
ncbi:MAG: DUF2065 domain-containing protein, partial [Burkholderiaceae bacterium]